LNAVFICPQPPVVSGQSSADAVTGASRLLPIRPHFLQTQTGETWRKIAAASQIFRPETGFFPFRPRKSKKIIPGTGNFNFLFRLCS
jgi:hypothetical protein